MTVFALLMILVYPIALPLMLWALLWQHRARLNPPDLPEHEAIKPLAFAMLLIWPIGLPLVYLSLLTVSRGAIEARRPTRISRACHFLHG